MILLEFLCCKSAPDLKRIRSDETFLVGVWVNRASDCEAFDLAVKALWSRGFVVLRHNGITRWKQKSPVFSSVLNQLWDEAERQGISLLVTETSVQLSGSTIRGAGKSQQGSRGERVEVTSSNKNTIAS